ncbi:tetratricopeptide repeat protein [Corallococcus sp. ZKHCc1 1396]|uniref:Tetratricopeptide repeat protein n=1 Tax=Corallococcus soli TaxID=2710757 RepID=A0ABR9PP97_9BACT|nr:tetratricopeptide repeat protein [Corallococcus soli]MBE4749736.1 tetratricopeptide repeat protein [Corallococcus soli]
MNTPLIALLLLAAAPPPQKAKELAAQKQWEELYLAFAAASPEDYPEAQRPAVAGPLLKGCEALLAEDAVMAYSLGERAVAFQETSGGLRCLARSALKTDQRASAEEALKKGLEHFPKDGAFGLELGRLLLQDEDSTAAIATLERVPAKSKEAKEARKLLQQARAKVSEAGAARGEVERLEKRLNGEDEKRAAKGEGDFRPDSLNYESGVGKDGMRVRANKRFIISYYNSERDFGQRTDYESQVASAMEEVHAFTRRLLGRAREQPLKVVLYTRDEFITHVGSRYASYAGLYVDGLIRMNDAAKLTQATKGALTHEYTNAVLDELCTGGIGNLHRWFSQGLADYMKWRFLGLDGPPRELANKLHGAARQGRLPKLSEMSSKSPIYQENPEVAFGTSAMAVHELVRMGGTEKILAFIDSFNQSGSFEGSLQSTYGKDLAGLDAAVHSALSGR